jgi:hypothetical protein
VSKRYYFHYLANFVTHSRYLNAAHFQNKIEHQQKNVVLHGITNTLNFLPPP